MTRFMPTSMRGYQFTGMGKQRPNATSGSDVYPKLRETNGTLCLDGYNPFGSNIS